MESEEIIKALKKLRDVKSISQRQIAEKLDISIGQYGHYETGHSQMSLQTFLKILGILETDPKEFFSVTPNNIDKKQLEKLIEALQEVYTKI